MLQDFDFPIAFINGTRDFFGSAEGADQIVRNSRFNGDWGNSGQSQIFIIPYCGNKAYKDQPDALTGYMIGFFNGVNIYSYDLKVRKEFSNTEN